MHVLVPHADAAQLMGGAPDGVDLDFWPGTDDYPENFERTEVFIPPWWAKSRAVHEIRRMPKLKLIQTLGAGYDWIAPALPSGVKLANVPGVNARPVAEWVLAALLSLLREFPQFLRDQMNAKWDQRRTGELGGSNVLVIGYGAVGKQVATLLRAFEAEVAVMASARRPGVFGPADLPTLIARADAIIVAVPLSPSTYRMIDHDFLRNMRDGSVLINVARGGVVDTDALVGELKTGRIRVALDVTDPEPLPTEHELWTLPGVLITPHVASVVPSFLPSSYSRVREQLVRIVNGDAPLNVVAG